MSGEIVRIGAEGVGELGEAERRYAERAVAENTKRAYGADWGRYVAWCEEQGLRPIPADPGAVARYITEMADDGKAAATIERHLATIRRAHTAQNLRFSSTMEPLRTVWQGIQRTVGTAQKRAAPLLRVHLLKIMEILPDDLIGKRDRALLLMAFYGALRESEVVGIDVEHLQLEEEGYRLHIPKSKTDQTGEGHWLGIPYRQRREACPVRATQEWLEASGITTGAVFRGLSRWGRIISPRLRSTSVSEIVKARVEAAGFDPEKFSGHSPRAGFATQAELDGLRHQAIKQQTRHEDDRSLAIYYRNAQLWKNNAAKQMGEN